MSMKAKEYLSRGLIMAEWANRVGDQSIVEQLTMDVAAEVVEKEGLEYSYRAEKEVMAIISQTCGFKVGKILEYRYVNGFSWHDIELITGYRRRNLFRLHRIGLEQVQAYLDRKKEEEAAV